MKNPLLPMVLALAAVLFTAGCESKKPACCPAPTPAAPTAPQAVIQAVPATAPAVPVAPAVTTGKIIRIKAGVSAPIKDSAGNEWLADQGFIGGDTIERPEVTIANTKDPVIYQAERYAMEGFTWPLANGKYQVKLHFCETFDGITGPGERVFSFNVQGQEFKDFDVFKKAGGAARAYVETVNVDITNGKLEIKFIGNVENPEINGIEIIPVS